MTKDITVKELVNMLNVMMKEGYSDAIVYYRDETMDIRITEGVYDCCEDKDKKQYVFLV